MRRKPQTAAIDPRVQWQKDNAARCGCRGADDLCPCQNDPELFTRPRIDWEVRAQTAERLLEEAREVLEPFARLARIEDGRGPFYIWTDVANSYGWADLLPDEETGPAGPMRNLRAARAFLSKLQPLADSPMGEG